MRQVWQIFGNHNIRSYFSSTIHRINHMILTDSRNIFCCCPVAKLCLTLCNPMNWKTTGPLSFTFSLSLLKLMSIESVMPSNRLILSSPSPPAFSLSQNQVLSSELAHRIKWPKYWSFSISTFNDYSGLIFFRTDWFDLLAVQGTLKNLVQYQNSVTSIFQHSAFLMSYLYVTTGKIIALTIWTFVSKWYVCFF